MPDPHPDDLFAGAPGAGPLGRPGYGAPVDPGADQLFGPAPSAPGGAAIDAWWSDQANALGRIVKSVGYGLGQPWEGRSIGLDPQTEDQLRKQGVLPDYQTGNVNTLNTSADAIIRPAADLADLLWNAPSALAGGYVAAARQASAELGGHPPEGAILPGTPQEEAEAQTRGAIVRGLSQGAITPESLEATAELASGVTKGYYPELAEEGAVGGAVTREAAQAARASDAAAARAAGVVAEGEAGFYDVHPLTPEAATARVSAADEAGIEPPAPLPPPPDVHALARRIDPETFGEYDALNAEAAIHRDTIAQLGAERAASPEALAAQADIDTIMGRVNNVPSRLTNAARGRLEAAQARLDDILTTDTPEMAQARGKLLDADYAMRDLAVDVSAAYRSAREIAPDLPETAPAEQPAGAPEAEAKGAPEPAAEMAAQSQAEAREVSAAGASPEAQAQVAPPNVLGDETLGHPAEAGAVMAREQAREIAPDLPETAGLAEGAAAPQAAAEGEGPAQRGGTPETVRVEPVPGAGETVARGLAKRTEEDAIARGLTNGFGDLPEYERVSMADQARQATDLMDQDYEAAKGVAMGSRAAPAGLLPESVYVAVEKRATAEGDVETLRQLATQSRLTTAATTMGQRIRTLGERDRTSPVGAIQAVAQARERVYGEKLAAAKSATVTEMKAATRAAASSPKDWEALVNSLLCK